MAEAFPLHWPEGWKRCPSYARGHLQGRTGFGVARDRLLRELRLLGAQHVVLSSNIPLRRDGLPYADFRRPDDPGVAVYFLYRKRQMCFACDRYYMTEDNVRTIALTIEAMGGIERWGASDMIERAFNGFQASAGTGIDKKHAALQQITQQLEAQGKSLPNAAINFAIEFARSHCRSFAAAPRNQHNRVVPKSRQPCRDFGTKV